MADPFGDSSAFDEFERERTPILSKLADTEEDEDEGGAPAELTVDSSDDESSDSSPGDKNESEERCPRNRELRDDAVVDGVSEYEEAKEGDWDETGPPTRLINPLKVELSQLKYEHSKMKPCHRMLDPNKYFKDDKGPAIQVVFMNHTIARKYRADIERFITSLLDREYHRREKDRIPPLQIRPNAVPLGNNADTDDAAEQLRLFNTSTAIGCSQFFKDFNVDSLGWPLVDYNPSLTDGWEIPRYTQVFQEALPVVADKQEPQRRPRPKQTCFNCGGEHRIAECTRPRDHRKIAENKRHFLSQKASSSQTLASARYIEDPRFANFKPGKISSDLRHALGLYRRELPPYIYRMRVLGYPPGHLEAAKVQTSGLSIFNKDGKEVGLDDEVLEDGEVNLEKTPKVQYDFDKLIDYPGYNVDMPEGTTDEYDRMGVPPMSAQHSKEVLQLYLTPQTSKNSAKRQHSDIGRGSRRKKQRTGNSTVNSSTDMDIESGEDGQLSQGSTADSVASSRQASREGSPTLDALEQAKRSLQLKLCMSSAEESDGTEPLVLDSCGEEVHSQDSETETSFIPPLPPTPNRPPLPVGTPPVTPQAQSPYVPRLRSPLVMGSSPSTPGSKPPTESPLGVPPLPQGTPGSIHSTPRGANISQLMKTPSTGGSMSVVLGTPVSHASVTKDKGLPDASKFASNIEEDIPFENLPNSTGTYTRMKKVLDFIRSRKTCS